MIKLTKRNLKEAFFLIAILMWTGCSQNSFSTSSTSAGGNYSVSVPAGSNVMEVTVGGACSGYINEICASVTICTPGTTTCQTIDNLLVDTGSYGLRVFKSVLSISLSPETNGSNTYGTCVSYMDGSIQWGSVQKADITMGSLTASSVPIQVIDGSFAGGPNSNCGTASQVENSPSAAGFNGILGVGLFAEDCGTACSSAATKYYYLCSSSSCSEAAMPISLQVTNPVSMLPNGYNNGVILQLPDVPTGGAASATGVLIMGIGTSTNNTMSGAVMYATDSSGDIVTAFNGSRKSAFIDSGSNGLYFPGSAVLTTCSGSLSSFFCPASLTTLSATIYNAVQTVSSSTSFYVLSANTIYAGSNSVYPDLGGDYSTGFDWGLPFFFGKTIGFGIDGKASTFGTGPYYVF
ncbi:MAG TPA: DUF3443 family protein [Bdellovibrio sp.]|uniref:DUF3443 family protein n=1 Tax=Bdellovibrio sp. TaxID=28201 RepID=UPI002EFD3E3A